MPYGDEIRRRSSDNCDRQLRLLNMGVYFNDILTPPNELCLMMMRLDDGLLINLSER